MLCLYAHNTTRKLKDIKVHASPDKVCTSMHTWTPPGHRATLPPDDRMLAMTLRDTGRSPSQCHACRSPGTKNICGRCTACIIVLCQQVDIAACFRFTQHNVLCSLQHAMYSLRRMPGF